MHAQEANTDVKKIICGSGDCTNKYVDLVVASDETYFNQNDYLTLQHGLLLLLQQSGAIKFSTSGNKFVHKQADPKTYDVLQGEGGFKI